VTDTGYWLNFQVRAKHGQPAATVAYDTLRD
jgi:hypothetical protein